MPIVFIPSLMRELTKGEDKIEARGSTVREVINNLEQMYPGIKERLVEKGQLRPSIMVAIDGVRSTKGLLEIVGEDSEVHFIPAVSGG